MFNIILMLITLLVVSQFGWMAGIITGIITVAISAAIASAENEAENETIHHDGWWTPRKPAE